MKHPLESTTASQAGEITSLGVLGARLTWTAAGPGALLLLSLAIINRGTGWLTILDALFGLVLILMAVGRWVEQRSGQATTLTGQPSTAAHARRYLMLLGPIGVSLWAIANLLGNHLLQ